MHRPKYFTILSQLTASIQRAAFLDATRQNPLGKLSKGGNPKAKHPSISPLGLDQLRDYERAIQLIGFCYLLHRRDLLARIALMIDSGYVGEDTLYEDLLAYALPGRVDLDEWYHEKPYTPLVHALHEADNEEAGNKLDEYLKQCYPAFKYVPWLDSHSASTEPIATVSATGHSKPARLRCFAISTTAKSRIWSIPRIWLPGPERMRTAFRMEARAIPRNPAPASPPTSHALKPAGGSPQPNPLPVATSNKAKPCPHSAAITA